MKAKPGIYNHLTVHMAFLALFPGFFFYHVALGVGTIDATLAGYFSPVALACAPLLLTAYVREIKSDRRFFTGVDFAFWGFLLYFFLVVAVNFANGANQVIVKEYIVSIIHFAVVFIIFRIADFNLKPFRWTLFVCLAMMALTIFTFSVDGSFDMKGEGVASSAEAVSTYQGFARSYLLTALVLLAFSKNIFLRWAIYALSVASLFVNGARSELIAMIAVIPMVEVLYARNTLVAFIIALVLTIVAITSYQEFIIHALPDNRVLEILDLSKSTSWESREYLFHYAMNTIGDHPLLGDFGSYTSLGGTGSYAHNVISAWVDLGFVGFCYVLAITVLPACRLVLDVICSIEKAKRDELILVFTLFLVTLLLIFTAKSFTEMVIAAALGRYAHYRKQHNSSISSSTGKMFTLRA